MTAHGAEGDGSTDDSAAVQSAVDAVKSTGGILFFPPGTYVFEGVEFCDVHRLWD
ncbi:glycosyl hydrolase family 28-related protein [Halomontanus rarus]|uniref:glycosyl hydrolase family 28-related protein n=1 Tax=Halomontanus rarus TaxID=3034020 RepID=UPI0031F331F7